MTVFIAVDGEAFDGKYGLLCSSTKDHILKEELSTKECFDFLLNLPKKTTVVCFGLNYDCNMWLRDLKRKELEELWDDEWTVWRDPDTREHYRIQWLPGHWVEIHRSGQEGEGGKSVTIYECWGFFQSSFVNALKAWGYKPAEELQSMKSQRGEFSSNELQRIIDYCHSECKLLVKLMDSLEAACKEAGIVPKRWLGAGSLAARLLESRSFVRDHYSQDEEMGAAESYHAILCSYFGGRVEMLKQGVFHTVLASDINSAYPYAITCLPSLSNGKLIHTKDKNKLIPNSIWRVRWKDIPGDLMPFPVRYKKDVYYPRSGCGWYHAIEVHGAMQLGYKIELLEGWYLKADYSDIQPLSWIEDIYKKRAEWKREKRAAEKVLKLSLNSMYGKFAQGIGYKARGYFHSTVPRWQSYYWAGRITAQTRATMLAAAYVCRNPLMIATDGLFCLGKPPQASVGLGGWERSNYDSLFVARPGVYLGEKRNGEIIVRSRGFKPRRDPKEDIDVDFFELREWYEDHDIHDNFRYKTRRFIGLGTALMRKDFNVWKTWEDSDRILSFLPSAKDVDLENRTFTAYSGILPDSEAYQPKNRRDPDEQKVQAQEQPMKIG